ncbi:MAG TPA: hypothetical protein DHV01_01585 [Rhodoferax sp.]|nr:hypothetical protein [Rhodoferax sp.]
MGSELLGKSAFANSLNEAKSAKERANIAYNYRSDARFVDDLQTLRSPILIVARAVSGLDDDELISVREVIRASANVDSHDIASSGEFADDILRLLESMLALRQLTASSSTMYEAFGRLLGITKLIEDAASLSHLDRGRLVKAFVRSITVKLPQLLSRDATPARSQPQVPETATIGTALALRQRELADAHESLIALNSLLVSSQDDNDSLDNDESEGGDLTPELLLVKQEDARKNVAARKAKVAEVRRGLRTLNATAKALIVRAGLQLDEESLMEAIGVISARIASPEMRTQQASVPVNSLPAKLPSFPGRIAFAAPPVLDVPEGVGYARILGMGDLMLVQEELKRYELGEITHIENVMLSERRSRSHRRTEKSEEFYSTITESETETERDLSSNERFQLGQEASAVIKADSSLEAGVNVSATYGTMLSVGVSTSASVSTSSETSKTSASDYSKEVTDRARNRVMEKMRTERSRRLTQEIEEVNEHGFDNTLGGDHIVGIYRWVDKVMQARLVNYGQRLLLEFVIPEPAVFLLQAQAGGLPKGVTAPKPDPRLQTLTAADITDDPGSENYYLHLAALYGVTDLEPPPVEFVQQADNFSFTGDPSLSQTTSKKITIAPDYSAYKVVFTRNAINRSSMRFYATVASAAGEMTSYKRVFELTAFVGELPISFTFSGAKAASVHVTIFCQRTDQAMTRWQIKTFKALQEGFQNLQATFNNQVAAAGVRQSSALEAFPPARNRDIERAELKRNVIAMLTGQHFDLFGSILEDAIPQVDFSQAIIEGQYIQFFENSFEWANMTYTFYPYFWGRKSTWGEKITYDNPDPTHLAFLQAGAARVVVPVSPEYNQVLVHYLDTGEIWSGTDAPELRGVSGVYADIAAEIRAQQGNQPTLPTVMGDEWEVRVPTSLVMLQKGTEL